MISKFDLAWFGWLVGWFTGVSTGFESFNAESSHFDKSLYVWFDFMAHQSLQDI